MVHWGAASRVFENHWRRGKQSNMASFLFNMSSDLGLAEPYQTRLDKLDSRLSIILDPRFWIRTVFEYPRFSIHGSRSLLLDSRLSIDTCPSILDSRFSIRDSRFSVLDSRAHPCQANPQIYSPTSPLVQAEVRSGSL